MRIKLHRKIKLHSLPTNPEDPDINQESSELKTGHYLKSIDQLQYLMFSENKYSLLIVLQGLDAAGKDGVIRHLFSGVNPQGCTVSAFKQPTALESGHDFLWRVHPCVPKKGSIAIFNRSHYEDVLITRVHGLIDKKECMERYDRINDFEKLISTENDTVVLKFFLHISKKEQLRRFGKRIEDPKRHWKISESDYREREYWNDYTRAYEQLLSQTSTQHAPWYVIPSDQKWYRNYLISKRVAEALENLKMKLPKPTVDIDKIKKKYHRLSKSQK